MLNFMARSTIKFHHLQGDSNSEIACKVRHHRKTVAKVLAGPLEPETSRNRISSVAVFEAQIYQWLDQKVQVKRMLELARADATHPYTGKITAFYDYVRKVRRTRQLKTREIAVRFEGMAGEFLQIDWGEVHKFPFTKAGMEEQTRYFFAARLKYSRFMFVRFTTDMVEETLVRCLIDSFLAIGGIPWVITTDNMKTVVIGRDAKHRPIWNPIWQKLAVEFQFHPEACWPASGNQKGAVENLVLCRHLGIEFKKLSSILPLSCKPFNQRKGKPPAPTLALTRVASPANGLRGRALYWIQGYSACPRKSSIVATRSRPGRFAVG